MLFSLFLVTNMSIIISPSIIEKELVIKREKEKMVTVISFMCL